MKIKLYKNFEHWYHGGIIWIYSDPHFGDVDCKLMDTNWPTPEEQVKLINLKVGKKDTFIILGDVGNVEWIKKLKGYKVLVMGNHDKGASNYIRKMWTMFPDNSGMSIEELRKFPDFKRVPSPRLRPQVEFDNRLFDEVYEGPVMINEKILLSHEPIKLSFGINIHGHDHNKENKKVVDKNFLQYNVCSNVIGYTPIRLDEIYKLQKVSTIHEITIENQKRNSENTKLKIEKSNDVKCSLCGEIIKNVNLLNLKHYAYYVDGGGAMHEKCYKKVYGSLCERCIGKVYGTEATNY